MKRWKVRPGLKFGRLTILYRMESTKWGESRVACKCDCGNTCVVIFKLMTRGDTRSCGCIQRERPNGTTHGATRTRAHRVWHNMRVRCQWEKSDCYHNYGGRGIKVCKRWQAFKLFLKDMGQPPTGKTLERINNNGNYCKSNCRWATPLEQGKNKRNNRLLTFGGETRHLSEWARIKGIKITTLTMRLKYGWTVERALCA